MSARNFGVSLNGVPLGGHTLNLNLDCTSVTRRPTGIEFKSPSPLPLFAELEIRMNCPDHGIDESHSGVVVACDPAKSGGYSVCLLYVPPSGPDIPASNSFSA
jgi:hypothetical protein